ncbi:hypothetical protein GAO09_23180 [Rhizobiales bacterium RZME27]|uniref:Glycosyl hydrolase n=1 Tax=Endobacterium cereale TaxID=2663029 RepID=A0A6A8ACB1_9HYPH|nr:hypothetical protein [Endobacterium cereale]MEB2845428.1 hypothetical protein [Endobacterium cereale]MQY48943.1 hypothetical protein [Endobacterium cereale]
MKTTGQKAFGKAAFRTALLSACFGVFACASSASAQSVTFEKPANKDFVAPIIGANTHFGTVRVLGYKDAHKVRDQLTQIGATSYRDYMPWQSFNFPPSGPVLAKSGRLMNFLPQAGITPMINLGLANSGVKGGVPPISDSALELFEDYVGKAVELTQTYDPIYEIWNEWNMYIGTGKPQPRIMGEGSKNDPRSASHYVRVAKVAVEKIRRVNPKAKIVVGAVGDDEDWGWAKAIVRDGVMDGADGLSVHLYNQCSANPHDRTAEEMIERVEKLQADLKQVRGGTETPLYITEFGWPTSRGNCGMPLNTSAYNFAQFILHSSAIPYIKGVWMHELKNISPDPVERESNYGLFSYEDEPKPAVCFMGAAAELVKSADSVEIREPKPDVFVARLSTGEGQKIVMWTKGDWVKAGYASSTQPVKAEAMCEAQGLAKAEPGRIGPAPVVLDFSTQDAVTIELSEVQK